MAQSNGSSPRPVVFITGASSGIGAAAVPVFAKAGYDVVLAARRKERLEQLADETRHALGAVVQGARIVPVVCDVTSDPSVQNAFRAVEEQFGRLDVLVNNAGFGVYGAVENTPLDLFRANMETNFFGVLRCTQAALPLLRLSVRQLRIADCGLRIANGASRAAPCAGDQSKIQNPKSKIRRRWGACIVMVSSFVGRRGLPGMSAYCASKFALEGLAEALRVELYDEGIAVSVVNPGVTQTGFFEAAQGARPAHNIPPERGMSADEVAKVILRAARHPCRNRCLTWAGKSGMALQWLAPSLFDQLLIRARRKAGDE